MELAAVTNVGYREAVVLLTCDDVGRPHRQHGMTQPMKHEADPDDDAETTMLESHGVLHPSEQGVCLVGMRANKARPSLSETSERSTLRTTGAQGVGAPVTPAPSRSVEIFSRGCGISRRTPAAPRALGLKRPGPRRHRGALRLHAMLSRYTPMPPSSTRDVLFHQPTGGRPVVGRTGGVLRGSRPRRYSRVDAGRRSGRVRGRKSATRAA